MPLPLSHVLCYSSAKDSCNTFRGKQLTKMSESPPWTLYDDLGQTHAVKNEAQPPRSQNCHTHTHTHRHTPQRDPGSNWSLRYEDLTSELPPSNHCLGLGKRVPSPSSSCSLPLHSGECASCRSKLVFKNGKHPLPILKRDHSKKKTICKQIRSVTSIPTIAK